MAVGYMARRSIFPRLTRQGPAPSLTATDGPTMPQAPANTYPEMQACATQLIPTNTSARHGLDSIGHATGQNCQILGEPCQMS